MLLVGHLCSTQITKISQFTLQDFKLPPSHQNSLRSRHVIFSTFPPKYMNSSFKIFMAIQCFRPASIAIILLVLNKFKQQLCRLEKGEKAQNREVSSGMMITTDLYENWSISIYNNGGCICIKGHTGRKTDTLHLVVPKRETALRNIVILSQICLSIHFCTDCIRLQFYERQINEHLHSFRYS
jgi:hypothetical protein